MFQSGTKNYNVNVSVTELSSSSQTIFLKVCYFQETLKAWNTPISTDNDQEKQILQYTKNHIPRMLETGDVDFFANQQGQLWWLELMALASYQSI